MASNPDTNQALRSLVEKVTSSSNGPGPQSSISPEALERLTEKLGEIVGLDAAQDFTPRRNERGELVNEEGLPIIDITEPVAGPLTSTSGSGDDDDIDSSPWLHADPIVNLSAVTPHTRERLRQQREKMLDMLEAEEAEEERQEKAREREEIAEIARKRAETSGDEKEKLKAAREMQKKMGRALLRNMADEREKEQKAQEEQRLKDQEQEAKRRVHSNLNGTLQPKKSVSFAAEVETNEQKEAQKKKEEWGDVVPAQVKNLNRPTLLTENRSEGGVMKMKVVERTPASRKSAAAAPPLQASEPEGDSDDETDVEDAPPSPPRPRRRLSPPPSRSPTLSEVSSSDTEDEELEEEVDLDFAALQRQIEIAYHEKRSIIGQDAAAAMQASSNEELDDLTTSMEDKIGVQYGQTTKPAISQFKAKKLASAYGAARAAPTTGTLAAATGISNFLVPASTARTIQKSIRTGKLDADGNLIGGEDDSASEDDLDPNAQEILELLKKGEVYNLGQDEIIAVKPDHVKEMNATKPSETAEALRLDQENKTLPALDKAKAHTSKFKVSRAAAGRPPPPEAHIEHSTPPTMRGSVLERKSALGKAHLSTNDFSPFPSPLGTPVNELPRSSPKGGSTPVPGTPVTSPSISLPSGPQTTQMPSMVVESPSFAPPTGMGMPSMIIDSPSFPPAQSSSKRPTQPPSIGSSSVLERTSMANGKSKAQTGANPIQVPTANSPAPSLPVPNSKAPMTMTASVRETRPPGSTTSVPSTADEVTQQPQKVSRFKQSRM
ncbi:hypothetical protein BKA70DRAFT_1554397 [Coprinopsis sp. MPI-PUGE-AT-0042]|nr:hypothetical protein BKA70DRAFT_1554397 [Coprinopsis sp. MPI-PUGE-AT-0042]